MSLLLPLPSSHFRGGPQPSIGFLPTPGFFLPLGLCLLVECLLTCIIAHSLFLFFSFFNSNNNHRKLFTGLPLGPCEFSTLYRGFWEASWGWGDHIPGSFFSPVAHAVPPNLISTPVGLICPRCTTSFSVHYASPVPGGLGRF